MINRRRHVTPIYAINAILIFFLATGVVAGDSKISPAAAGGFKTVTIGTQQWMAENLNVGVFRNGEPIPEAKTKAQWEAAYKTEAPAWCYYNNDSSNGKKYGRLYNWYAVNDPRGLAPVGWHVPTDTEWQTLVTSLGGLGAAFTKMKATDGFAAKPGGHRWFEDASFLHLGTVGFWWSATKRDKWNAWYHAMHFGLSEVGRDAGGMNTGFSVRCVKDPPISK